MAAEPEANGVRLILFVSGSAAVDVQHWSIQLPTGETLPPAVKRK